jgi:hypothetical protein
LQAAPFWLTFGVRSAVHRGVAVPKGKLNLPDFIFAGYLSRAESEAATTDNPKRIGAFTINEDKQ